MLDLRPFQKRFIAKAISPAVDTAVLSMPRGNGKSALAGYLGARAMTPTDPLFRPGTESVIVAGSLEQGRKAFLFMREFLENSKDYRWADSLTRVQVTHKATNTAFMVRGANAKNIMGLVKCPWVIADEPGAWEVNGGELMHDAIQTAQGKPGSPLTAIYIGTLAPASSGWWPELVERGSVNSVYVQALQGDPKSWDDWHTIRKANPLTAIDKKFRRKLMEERDEARLDPRKKARFLSYRLNVPTADESTMLLTVDEWKMALQRPVGLPAGPAIVGIDLGGGRAWSAAVAVWESGLIDAVACAPGIPNIAEQEKRDRVPKGTYQSLVDAGVLVTADGRRVQPPDLLWELICERWGVPVRVVCDRFRLGELEDAIQGQSIMEPRVTRWSDAAADVRALRKFVKDGPFSVAETSRKLFAASLMRAKVMSDDAGNTRLAKDTKNNVARDDVAAGLLLGAGAYERAGGGQSGNEPESTEATPVFMAG